MNKWTIIIQQKTRAACLLGGILLLVIFNNLYQGRQFSKLSESFSSLYEDRLLAESYIYRISELLHAKTEALDTKPGNDYGALARRSEPRIAGLMDLYCHTKLTASESGHFTRLRLSMEKLRQLEADYMSFMQQGQDLAAIKASLKHGIHENLQHLADLSDIQVSTGKAMNGESRSLMAGNEMSSQLETVVLIIIAIMIQMLVFASRSARSLIRQNPSLN